MKIRFMDKKEIDQLPPGHKKSKSIKDFIGVWTKFQNWEKHPPIIAKDERKGRIIGFHAATFNKKTYINSYYLYVDEDYRGKGIAGELFMFAIWEGQSRNLTRFKNACIKGADGDVFYKGFGLKPIAESETHNYYDFPIEGVAILDDLGKGYYSVPEKEIAAHIKKGRKILI